MQYLTLRGQDITAPIHRWNRVAQIFRNSYCLCATIVCTHNAWRIARRRKVWSRGVRASSDNVLNAIWCTPSTHFSMSLRGRLRIVRYTTWIQLARANCTRDEGRTGSRGGPRNRTLSPSKVNRSNVYTRTVFLRAHIATCSFPWFKTELCHWCPGYRTPQDYKRISAI